MTVQDQHFEPSTRVASSSSLKGGQEYEHQVSLSWMISYFTKGPSTFKLYFEQREVRPFDDLVIVGDKQTVLQQLKSNQDGSLDSLISGLKKKKTTYDKDPTPSFPSMLVTYLDEAPALPRRDDFLELETFELTAEFIELHDLSVCLTGARLCKGPSLPELSKQNEQWFLDRFGDQGIRIYQEALDSVRQLWKRPSGLQRSVDQDRALWLLGLETRKIRHNVHDVSGLIPRERLVDKLEQAVSEGNVLMLGQPGCGKSALLDLLTDRVEEADFSRVLRYSFFIGPSDSYRNERLGFGFTINEIFQADMAFVSRIPVHVTESQVLNRLIDRNEKITVILDGLDHLGRASEDELERLGRFLAALASKDKIRLLISVQVEEQLPGAFPRESFSRFEVPEMTAHETSEVVRLLTGKGVRDRSAELLTEKSEGNPLLLSYLLNLVDVSIVNEYNLKRELADVDMSGSVIGYLGRLLDGLSQTELNLLWYLAYFRFGFALSFYKQVAGKLGIGSLDINSLWAKVKHIFKPVGPERFLAWHYSLSHVLEKEKNIAPIDAVPELHNIQQSLPDSADRVIYHSLLTIDVEPDQIVKCVEDLRDYALTGRIRASHAEAIVLDALKVLASQRKFRQLVRALFIRSEFVAIIDTLSHSDTPVNQAIANAGSELRKPSLLYPGVGIDILNELGTKDGLWPVIRAHPELQWIVDRVQPVNAQDIAVKLAINLLRGAKSFQGIVKDYTQIQWSVKESHPDKWRKATGAESCSYENSAFYMIGRILSRQLPDREVYSAISSYWPDNDRLQELKLLSACGASEARSDYSITREFASSLLNPILPGNRRFWHLADFSDSSAVDILDNEISRLDIEALVESAASNYSCNEESFDSVWRELFSCAVTAAQIGRKGIVLSVLRTLELLPHNRGFGHAAILREVCECHSSGKDVKDSLKQCFRDGIGIYDFSGMAEMLTRAFEMGLLELNSAEDSIWAFSLGSRYRYDAIGALESRARSLSNAQREKVRTAIMSSMDTEPHSWVNAASRVAALYTVANEEEAGEEVAADALGILGVYGYHKEMTFSHLLTVVKFMACAGYIDEAREALSRVGGYLPIIDIVTDGDHTRHWFHNIMNFTFEECLPQDSKLLKYIDSKLQSADSDMWFWRLGCIFEVQLANVSHNYWDAWAKELLSWFLRPVEYREAYTFKNWAFRFSQSEDFREHSEIAQQVTDEILIQASNEISYVHKQYTIESPPKRGFYPSFEDYLRAVEKATGLESILKSESFRDSAESTYSGEKATTVISLPDDVRLDEYMVEKMFWYPDWYGCKPALRDVIAHKINCGGQESMRLVCNSLALAAEVDYFDASAMAVGLAGLQLRIGLKDEFLHLMGEFLEYFERRFIRLEKDEEFARALTALSFHSLSLDG